MFSGHRTLRSHARVPQGVGTLHPGDTEALYHLRRQTFLLVNFNTGARAVDMQSRIFLSNPFPKPDCRYCSGHNGMVFRWPDAVGARENPGNLIVHLLPVELRRRTEQGLSSSSTSCTRSR